MSDKRTGILKIAMVKVLGTSNCSISAEYRGLWFEPIVSDCKTREAILLKFSAPPYSNGIVGIVLH
jgi:hypothetical protein